MSPSPPMAFPETLRQFDEHMEATGLSESTRHMYRYQLVLLWCDYLYVLGLELETVSEALLDRYLAGMDPHGSKRGSSMRAMKALFGWAEGRIRPDNPSAHMRVPRPKVGEAPDLSDEYLRQLLKALFKRDARRGWAVMLCFATGCRVGSLVALVPTDVDLRRERITFRVAKNNRPYTAPLVGLGLIAAKNLVEITQTGTLVGVGATRFRQWMHQAEQDAGIPRVWPHLLRHAAATRWAESGDVDSWRRNGNWSDLSQWPRYVAGDEERQRATAARVKIG